MSRVAFLPTSTRLLQGLVSPEYLPYERLDLFAGNLTYTIFQPD